MLGIRGIVEDKDSKFWFSDLLHRYDVHPDRAAENATPAPEYTKERGIPTPENGDSYFMSGITDDQGVSWIATYRTGVWRHDGEQLTHFPVTVDGQPITLYSIYADNEGVLWLGTYAAGTWRFSGTTFERFRP